MLVQLPCKSLSVRVVSEGWDERVGDHDGFEMEAAVADIAGFVRERETERGQLRSREGGDEQRDLHDSIRIGSKTRSGAAEDLSWAEWLDLRHRDFELGLRSPRRRHDGH